MEDVLNLGENYIKYLFKTVLDIDIPTPFPRYTYNEVMARFGSDKPDTRFGMEIFDLTETVKDSEFGVFKNAIACGGSVRGITAKNAVKTYSRKEIDKGSPSCGCAVIQFFLDYFCHISVFLIPNSSFLIISSASGRAS